MYSIEEYDGIKTKVLKYVLYKKRTENEIKQKFQYINDGILNDVIEELKELGYICDAIFIEKQVNEFLKLKTLSIKEIKFKLMQKGIDKNMIEEYIENHKDKLDEYEESNIEKIKNKKVSTMTDEEIETYLLRRGFRIEK